MKGRTLLQGAGIGILYMLAYLWPQLSPSHIDLYHRLLPVNTLVAAIAIDLVIVCIAGIALLYLLDRFDQKQNSLLWVLLFSLLAGKTVSNLIMLSQIPDHPVTPGRIFVFICILLTLLWWKKQAWYSTTIDGLRGLLFVIGFCIFWMLPQIIYFASIRQPRESYSYTRPTPHTDAPHRRVIWLLLDELSYDQAFDRRYPGLRLPNFDQFRSTSVTFSNISPEGYLTERILPALFLGRDVSDIRASMRDQLFVKEDGKWQAFDPSATLFADAQRHGWTTGIVGWYNPYCHLLPQQLNSCFWTEYPPVFIGHQSTQYSVTENALAPFVTPLERMAGKKVVPTLLSISDHLNNYKILKQPAMDLIANEDIDFAFIHLPLPHPPGLYDRQSQVLQAHGSYIDNLALADKVLGEVLAAIAATRSADQTTFVISSDHSWRIPMWKGTFLWTAEDQRAYRGTFDQRPVIMVHFPQESQPSAINQPVRGLKLHDMLEKMLDGSMNSPQDLESWLSQPSQASKK